MLPFSQQTILVTGATDGIGRETALEIAKLGAHVLLHGRSLEKCRVSEDFIRKAVPSARLASYAADFSSQREITAMAQAIRAAHPALHVLVNNAGTYMNERVLTEDGLEMTFAVNHMAPFLLTKLLLPALSYGGPARIVTVSSIAHLRGTLDFENLQGERAFDAYGAYALSKLCNVLLTTELARRLKDGPVTANCLHPGVITTKLLWKGFRSSGASVAQGARTSVYLATSPDVENVSGAYFNDCRKETPAPAAQDVKAAQRLWEISEALVKR